MSVCRGCGGDGVGQHVTRRERQIIDHAGGIALIRHRTKFVHIAAGEPRRERLAFHGPLAHAVAYLDEQIRGGWKVAPHSLAFYDLMLAGRWACDWCNGTGVPQLSVHALTQGAR